MPPNRGKFARDYDAIVIGTGAGGSSLAYRLAQTGARILVVERGDYLQVPPGTPRDTTAVYLGRYTKPGVTVFCVGGLTKFYGAALYRMRESDFREVAHRCGVSPRWPISYRDLEPYYEKAEILYRVHGSDDGDPSAPPRRAPYPFPPLPHHPLVAALKERLARSGTQASALPRGVDFGPAGRCVLCATCDAYYCRLDAKLDAEVAALRPALATGRVQLATRTECAKIITDDRGKRVSGVLLRDAHGEFRVCAEVVAICAGVDETPLLLRRSRSGRHPNGLGNEGGALGKYLGGHSAAHIFALVRWKGLPPIHTKTLAINAFHDGTSEWPYPLGIVQLAGQMPFWDHASRLIRPGARIIGTRSLVFFYASQAIPTRAAGLVFSGDDVADCVMPEHDLKTFAALRINAVRALRAAGYPTFARRRPDLWHSVGTARMGSDPADSVTDANGKVHGVDGLYVADQSVLPSAGAVNTTLTTIAVALRLGDHIATNLLRSSAWSGPRENARGEQRERANALRPIRP
ncbi:MAG TPA: GMC family oxidoreductase [Rhizomicrobium sp.]|nr:GMC family oxidoreductase [Rhizomicrobium sp.]